MNLTPAIAIHLSAALAATVVGPLALWARRGRTQHPRLHRAFGYAWVTLMLLTAVSALFIRELGTCPTFNGYTFDPSADRRPSLLSLGSAFWYPGAPGHRRPPPGDAHHLRGGPASSPAASPCCPAATWASWSGTSGWPWSDPAIPSFQPTWSRQHELTPHHEQDLDRLARRHAGAQMGWYIHASVYLVVNLLLATLSAIGAVATGPSIPRSAGAWACHPRHRGAAAHPPAPACASAGCNANASA